MATLEAYGKDIVGSYGTVDSLISDKYNPDRVQPYNTGDYCIYNNALYKCKDDNVTGTWDATKWDLTNVDTELTSINSDLSELITRDTYDGTTNSSGYLFVTTPTAPSKHNYYPVSVSWGTATPRYLGRNWNGDTIVYCPSEKSTHVAGSIVYILF